MTTQEVRRKMPILTMTLPIRPGKLEAWRRFCQELQGVRRHAYETSRRRLGIVHEQFALVQTPIGDAALANIEAADVGKALAGLAASEHPFDRWFKARLLELHGVSLGQIPMEHRADPAFEWEEE